MTRKSVARLTTFTANPALYVCPSCKDYVRPKFSMGKSKTIFVHCKIYKRGVWQREQHWHQSCYDEKQPYGAYGEFCKPITLASQGLGKAPRKKK